MNMLSTASSKTASSKTYKILALFLCLVLSCQQTGFAQLSAELNLAGRLGSFGSGLVQDRFRPLHLRYLSYDVLKNNFKLLVDKGDAFGEVKSQNAKLQSHQNEKLEAETKKLLNYFYVGLALPNDTFWVNLRPDAPDNIIDRYLAQTDIGRVMLEADVQLKKDTAAATSPQTPEGKAYWNKLYQKAGELFGSENITIPTLTRPWIVPDEIIIRETKDSAYIYKATLKVMLEADYFKGEESVIARSAATKQSSPYTFSDPRLKILNEYSAQLVRELIIPKLNKAINSAKRYASLRQVYYSLILAQWFKARSPRIDLRGKSAGTIYGRIDSRNLSNLTSIEPCSPSTYFQAYQASFKNGEYNLKESIQAISGQSIRSYFSGGMKFMLNFSPFGEPKITSSPVATLPAASSSPAAIRDNGMIGISVAGDLREIKIASSPLTEKSETKVYPLAYSKNGTYALSYLIEFENQFEGTELYPVKSIEDRQRASNLSEQIDNLLTQNPRLAAALSIQKEKKTEIIITHHIKDMGQDAGGFFTLASDESFGSTRQMIFLPLYDENNEAVNYKQGLRVYNWPEKGNFTGLQRAVAHEIGHSFFPIEDEGRGGHFMQFALPVNLLKIADFIATYQISFDITPYERGLEDVKALPWKLAEELYRKKNSALFGSAGMRAIETDIFMKKGPTEFLSERSLTNTLEYLAEALSLFFLDPDLVYRHDPVTFNFINAIADWSLLPAQSDNLTGSPEVSAPGAVEQAVSSPLPKKESSAGSPVGMPRRDFIRNVATAAGILVVTQLNLGQLNVETPKVPTIKISNDISVSYLRSTVGEIMGHATGVRNDGVLPVARYISGRLLGEGFKPGEHFNLGVKEPTVTMQHFEIRPSYRPIDYRPAYIALLPRENLKKREIKSDRTDKGSEPDLKLFPINEVLDELLKSDDFLRDSPFIPKDRYAGYPTEPRANLVATIPGSIRPDLHIIIGAHMDGSGANDNASGVTVLLALLHQFYHSRPPFTIDAVFFDAEEYPQLVTPGSSAFVQGLKRHLSEEGGEVGAVIVFDMVGGQTQKHLGTRIPLRVVTAQEGAFFGERVQSVISRFLPAVAIADDLEIFDTSSDAFVHDYAGKTLALMEASREQSEIRRIYDTPLDKPETLDYAYMQKVAEAVIEVIRQVAAGSPLQNIDDVLGRYRGQVVTLDELAEGSEVTVEEVVARINAINLDLQHPLLIKPAGGRDFFVTTKKDSRASSPIRQRLSLEQELTLSQKLELKLSPMMIMSQRIIMESDYTTLERAIPGVLERVSKREGGTRHYKNAALGLEFDYIAFTQDDYKDDEMFGVVLQSGGGGRAHYSERYKQWFLFVDADFFPEEFGELIAIHEYGEEVFSGNENPHFSASQLEFEAAKRLGKIKAYTAWINQNFKQKFTNVCTIVDGMDAYVPFRVQETDDYRQSREDLSYNSASARAARKMIEDFKWPAEVARYAARAAAENNRVHDILDRASGEICELAGRLPGEGRTWKDHLAAMENIARETIQRVAGLKGHEWLHPELVRDIWGTMRDQADKKLFEAWPWYSQIGGRDIVQEGLRDPGIKNFGIFAESDGWKLVEETRKVSIAAAAEEDKGKAGSPLTITVKSLFKSESGKSYFNTRGLSKLLQEVLGKDDAQVVRPVIIGSAAHFSGEDGWVDLGLVGDVDIVLEAKEGTDYQDWERIRQEFFQRFKGIFEQDGEYVAKVKDTSGRDSDEKEFYDFKVFTFDNREIEFTLPPTFTTDSAEYMLESALRPLTTGYSSYEKPIKRYLMTMTYLGSYLGGEEKEALAGFMSRYARIVHAVTPVIQREEELDSLTRELQSRVQGDLRRRYEQEIAGNQQKMAKLLAFSRRFVIVPETSSSPVDNGEKDSPLQRHIPMLSSVYSDKPLVLERGLDGRIIISRYQEGKCYWHVIGTDSWMVTDPDAEEKRMDGKEENWFKEHISRSVAFSSFSREDKLAVEAELERVGYVSVSSPVFVLKDAYDVIKSEKTLPVFMREIMSVDASALSRIGLEEAAAGKMEFWRKTIEEHRVDVALIDGKVVAYNIHGILTNGAGYGLLMVAAEVQDGGVGSALMDRAMEKLRDKGIKQVKIEPEFDSGGFYNKYFHSRYPDSRTIDFTRVPYTYVDITSPVSVEATAGSPVKVSRELQMTIGKEMGKLEREIEQLGLPKEELNVIFESIDAALNRMALGVSDLEGFVKELIRIGWYRKANIPRLWLIMLRYVQGDSDVIPYVEVTVPSLGIPFDGSKMECVAMSEAARVNKESAVVGAIWDPGLRFGTKVTLPKVELITKGEREARVESPTQSSSPVKAKPGGIDFRSLPIVTQATANLRLGIAGSTLAKLNSMNLETEGRAIGQMLNSGIKPSAERIKDYVQASCLQNNSSQDLQKVISCIAEILRAEEEECCATDPGLRDILIVLDSGVSAQELKSIFTAGKS